MSGPVWSIILASRNGEDTLPRCLSALALAIAGNSSVEVILTDNASTDQTPDIMNQFGHDMRALILTEPRPGKAFALNTAIARAQGEWLLFIDDDILVTKDWLSAFLKGPSQHLSADVLAGQIRPSFSGQPPQWMQDIADAGAGFGCTRPEVAEGPYSAEQVKGGNFAVRHAALNERRFDEGVANFGAAIKQPTGGEDTRLVVALQSGPESVIYLPEARAEHIVGEDEYRLGAMVGRQMRIGRSIAVSEKPTAFNAAKALAKVALFSVIWPIAWITRRSPLIGRSVLGVATNLGRLDHWFLGRKSR